MAVNALSIKTAMSIRRMGRTSMSTENGTKTQIIMQLSRPADGILYRYTNDTDLAQRKQSRKGAKNGRAKPCKLFNERGDLVGEYPYRRAAIDALIEIGVANPSYNKESIIRKLSNRGYKGYHLTDA